MRLSEKGCVHLNEWMVHKLPIDAFEFKPEDFTNCVVLTVEEAKKIANDLLVYERLYRGAINNSSISEQDSLDEFCNSQSQKLFKRIEQADGEK